MITRYNFYFKDINLEDPASVTGSGDKKIKQESKEVDCEGKEVIFVISMPIYLW